MRNQFITCIRNADIDAAIARQAASGSKRLRRPDSVSVCEWFILARLDYDGPPPPHCPELGGCYLFTGEARQREYGELKVDGYAWRTHRYAWTLVYGPIPDGLEVLHRCDTPLCCRPDHLFLGTQPDNLTDMRLKNRHGAPPKVGRRDAPPSTPVWHGKRKLNPDQEAELLRREAAGESQQSIADDLGVTQSYVSAFARGARRNGPGAPRGEKHGGAKLTDAQAAEALARCRAGESQKSVADYFGVSQPTISALVTGRRRPPCP